MIYFAFFAFSVFRGFNAVTVKIAQKDYLRSLSDSIVFTMLFSLFQLVFLFIIPPWYKYTFRMDMLLYPACFAIFYFLSYMFLISALKEGPTSLTNVIYSFQSIVPIVVSLFLWKEKVNILQAMGLVLFVIVMFLFNQGSYSEGAETKKISFKWALLAAASTLVTGIAVTFTKQYMLIYDGFIKEYLILYNLVVVIICIPWFFFSETKNSKKLMSDGRFLFYTAAPGLLTDVTNMIYMFYITKFKSALFFPLISILNIVSVVILSRTIFKENVSKGAYIGIFLSIIAIYLLGVK